MNTNSVRSGFALNLGLVSMPVDLFSVIPSKKAGAGTRTLCKKHMQPINQVYRCPVDEEISPETVKGIAAGKGKFVIPKDDDEATDIEKYDGIDLVAVPTDALHSSTVPSDKLYYLTPHNNEGVKVWEVLFRLAQDKKRTLIGQTALRKNARKIYQLVVFNEYLTLQELVFPEQIREAPEIAHPKVEKAIMDLAKQALNASEVNWDDFDSEDEGLKRLRARMEGGTVITTDDGTATEGKAEVIDLMEALKASIAERSA